MKIRTVYFKVSDMDRAVTFWEGLLGQAPPKRSSYWSEFKCSNTNLGLLWLSLFSLLSQSSELHRYSPFLTAKWQDAVLTIDRLTAKGLIQT